jgi:hypothetical protein
MDQRDYKDYGDHRDHRDYILSSLPFSMSSVLLFGRFSASQFQVLCSGHSDSSRVAILAQVTYRSVRACRVSVIVWPVFAK